MKVDLFSIGKFTIHGYGLMIAIGIVLCVFLGIYRAKKYNMEQEAVLDIAIYSVIAGFLGAKLLFVIVEFPRFLKDPLGLLGSEGFVVYGGIIAGVFAAMVYCRIKNLNFKKYFDLLIPGVALAQGFGRIGCFLAGCCYGRETTSWLGVVFPPGGFAPAGIKILPTQLFASAGDFLITIILLATYNKRKHDGDTGALYLLLYGIGRFLIEFLRADERGGWGIFSTSQWISLVIVVVAVVLFKVNKKESEI